MVTPPHHGTATILEMLVDQEEKLAKKTDAHLTRREANHKMMAM
jgi:hypothetical protein